jgi:hypothetical protein
MREIEDWTATAEALASKVEQIDDMILATVEPARCFRSGDPMC